MITPGIYRSDKITVNLDGSILLENLHPVEAGLKTLWNGHEPTFETFVSELARQGIVSGNRWLKSAESIKGCYDFLHQRNIVPELTAEQILKTFSETFTLKISDPRSLRGNLDSETYCQHFEKLFKGKFPENGAHQY
jgi:hypothetical protein